MKPTVYLETTIPSYLVARPSIDLLVAGHQFVTVNWWERRRKDFELFVSRFVLDEASGGDPNAAALRMRALDEITELPVDEDVMKLARRLIDAGLIYE